MCCRGRHSQRLEEHPPQCLLPTLSGRRLHRKTRDVVADISIRILAAPLCRPMLFEQVDELAVPCVLARESQANHYGSLVADSMCVRQQTSNGDRIGTEGLMQPERREKPAQRRIETPNSTFGEDFRSESRERLGRRRDVEFGRWRKCAAALHICIAEPA